MKTKAERQATLDKLLKRIKPEDQPKPIVPVITKPKSNMPPELSALINRFG
jgi:hypothetical protein